MEQKKSQIDSFDVSLGSSPSPARSASQKQLEKWNILVCSDLGYATQKPEMVHIAEWNEFLAARNIVLSGTIEEDLTGAKKPLYVEFPVKSMKDMSLESIMGNAAPFSAYSRAVFSLSQLIDGKTNRDDAATLIKKAGLPKEEETRVLGMLVPRPAAPHKKSAARPQNSPIDNILSMVDGTSSLGDGTSSPGDGPSPGPAAASADSPHNVTDALFASVIGQNEAGFDKKAADAFVRECQSRLMRLGETLLAQPFFASRVSSWNCLWALAKVIGRKKEVSLSVVSAARQDMEENLPKVLSSCMESGAAPDIIVWDYGVSLTNASMEAASRLAKAADQYKCMVIAPLSMDDPLLSGISGRNSISHLFDEVRMLPFKKLRTEPAGRCLCLCGPGLSPSGRSKSPGDNCCWYVATRWTEMLLGANDPFSAKDPRPPVESVFSQDALFCCDVAQPVAEEAAAMGLTLFEGSVGQASLDKAKTVIGNEQAAECYSSFLFNLVVNRVIRLAGIRLLTEGAQTARADAASVLERFLRTELLAYGAVTADAQVTAAANSEDKIVIDVKSDVTVSGHPVRFTFSF